MIIQTSVEPRPAHQLRVADGRIGISESTCATITSSHVDVLFGGQGRKKPSAREPGERRIRSARCPVTPKR